ncbi:transposase [Umezakia ovalisporum]|jgi:hypothetical protein|uniref:transposase n=1 Tax=Umezakia ovalisporum TaxID=75695 RepID=UPI002475BB5A|nr:transposase [Umezakia ovalisporum]MDH6089714.1 transposase [Umezakia ovalisporum Ak1311]
MAPQSARQMLKSVGESITSYNKLVALYYQGDVHKPSLPKYRKGGGFAAVTFPRQALTWKNGCFYPSIRKKTKPELLTEITLQLPNLIDSHWVKEVTIKPYLGEFWIDWVIDNCNKPVNTNPELDYSQGWSFDHRGTNWLTGVSTRGKSLIIDGRTLKSINQGYCPLVAKYKQNKFDFYWDSNLDRVQLQRNNQMQHAINKAARFIINQCLNDRIGNLIIGCNHGQKNSSKMSKCGSQNFVSIPTGGLIERLKQICPEYGIKITIGDYLYKHGEKLDGWKPSGQRVKRGLYKTSAGILANAYCNGAANILTKVATQLGANLAKVGRGALTLPIRVDLFNGLSRSYPKGCVPRLQPG